MMTTFKQWRYIIYIYHFFAALVKGCRGFLFCVLCFCYSASVTSRLGHSELHTPSDRFFWTPFSKYSSQWLECGYCWRLYANVYHLYISILGPDHERLLAWHSALRLALLNSSRRTSNIPSTPWQRYQRTTKKTKTNVSHVNKKIPCKTW